MRRSKFSHCIALLFGAVGCAAPTPIPETDAGDDMMDGATIDLDLADGGYVDVPPDVPVNIDLGEIRDLGGEEAPIAPDDLIYAMSIKYCREILTCPTTMDSETERFIKLREADEAACVDGYVRLLANYSRLQENVSRVHAGTMTLDGALARECTNETQCERFDLDGVGSFGPCDTMFDGTVGLGGECLDSDDCSGIDTHCVHETESCLGTCQAAVALGESCTNSRDCDTDSATSLVICDPTSVTPTCKAFTYSTAAPIEGVACGMSATAAEVTHVNCAPGYFCDAPTRRGAGFCRAQFSEGQECSDDATCASEYMCSREETPACRVPGPLSQFIGEACNPDEGLQCDAWRNLSCIDGYCVALGDGSLGASCDERSFCNAGLYCGAENTCTTQLADGAECSESRQCLSGRCDDAAFTCTARAEC